MRRDRSNAIGDPRTHRHAGRAMSCAVLVLALVLSWPAGQALGFGIALKPTTVEVIVEPGQSYRQVITISNVHRERTIALTLGLADWDLDEDGGLVLLPPDSYERSPANWVRFGPATLTLEPLTSKQVVVDIGVPAAVASSGDHRLAVIASTLLPPKAERAGTSGVWRRFQVATLFYLAVAPSRSDPRVVDARVERDGDLPALRLAFDNPGDAHARIRGRISLLDGNGEAVHRQDVSTVVLDGRSVATAFPIEADWEDLPAGDYAVALELRDSFNPDGEPNAPVPVDATLPVIRHR